MPFPTPPPPPAQNTSSVTLFGPLPVRSQSSFNHLVFQSYPEKSIVLKRGEKTMGVGVEAGNTAFVIATQVGQIWSEDAEMQQARLSYRQGVGHGWEWGAETRLLSRNGGVLDTLVSAWHRYALFNLRDSFRDGSPHNTQAIYIAQNGQLVLVDNNAATALTLLAVTAKKQVTPLIAVRSTVKLPLASRQSRKYYLDNGATDVSLGVSGRLPTRGRFTPQYDASLLYAGTNHVGTAFQNGKRLNVQMMIVGEYHLKDDAHLVLQQENATFPYNFNLGKAPLRRQQMTLGYAKRLQPQTTGFLAISENLYGPVVVGYAPDVQLSLGFSYKMH
jgi:hypothetical protein